MELPQKARFAVSAIGIFVCYFYFGILQERMYVLLSRSFILLIRLQPAKEKFGNFFDLLEQEENMEKVKR
jgi:hypothetical protein